MNLEEYKATCQAIYAKVKQAHPEIGFINALTFQVWRQDLVSTVEKANELLAISPSAEFVRTVEAPQLLQANVSAQFLASMAMVRDILLFNP